jgi:hypothetical protein
VVDLHLSWGYPPCGLTISWDAVITTLNLVLEDGEVLGTVEPLRIPAAEAQAMRKDDHLKAAFIEQHAHRGAKAVHVVALTGFGTIPTIPVDVLPALHGAVDDRAQKWPASWRTIQGSVSVSGSSRLTVIGRTTRRCDRELRICVTSGTSIWACRFISSLSSSC